MPTSAVMASASASAQMAAMAKAATVNNSLYGEISLYILVAVGAIALLSTLILVTRRKIRMLACLGHQNQQYFRDPNFIVAAIKQHLVYAPLLGKRRSAAVTIGPAQLGTVPTRLQTLLLLGIVIMNATLMAYGLEWRHMANDDSMRRTTLLKHLRNRSGNLATANMLPIFVMAGRNSLLIRILNVPYDTVNLLHRWFGRMVACLVTVHAACEFILFHDQARKMRTSSLGYFRHVLNEANFILWGFIAFIAILTILFTSVRIVRRAFYDVFWHIHVVLAGVTLGGSYVHLRHNHKHAWVYIKIAIAFWVFERCMRLARILYHNVSLPVPSFSGQQNGKERRPSRITTKAHVEILPCEVMRVTLSLQRPWLFTPGQYLYLTIPFVGLWTSHPFSIAWSSSSILPHPYIDIDRSSIDSSTPHSLSADPEKGMDVRSASSTSNSPQSHTVTLLIRKRNHYTSRLYRHALEHKDTTISTLPCLIDGPYVNPHTYSGNFQSCGTVLLFAGGIGITHALPYLPYLISGHISRTAVSQRILLTWAVRSAEQVAWIESYMTEILAIDQGSRILRVHIHVSQPQSPQSSSNDESEDGDKEKPRKNQAQQLLGIEDPNNQIQILSGRPDINSIMDTECKTQIGAMGVGVCGPGDFADDVRSAVRKHCGTREIEFADEGFGW